MGDIGEPIREIEFEPMPLTAPVPEPAPVTIPQTQPDREEVPA